MSCVAAGIVLAGSAFPIVGGLGLASNKMADTLSATSADLVKGDLPAMSTMTDVQGRPIAWLFDQQRVVVPSDHISDAMKLAIVSIEDRRFFEHNGVDWKGTARAFVTNTTSGGVQQGASTLDQQIVKNYEFLVAAKTDSERRAAIETTPARKIREIRMALTLDRELHKDEILSKYLNLVPFGNGAFGVQTAAQTYFGVDAKDLSIAQSAMLAGILQSTSRLNPYINPEDALFRRNTVIGTMIETGAITQAQALNAQDQPLGILPEPKSIPRGCIAAGNRGFYCDYVLSYLARNGISREMVARSGFTIKTNLDQRVQDSVQSSLNTFGQPKEEGVAEVMSVVTPGQDSHKVVAVASSREYGLDLSAKQTVQPQPFSMVGDGAGSIFKIFTVAAALEKGMGSDAKLPVPVRVQLEGMGTGGAKDCPPGLYCVENAAKYPSSMSVTDALAKSPNTAFVKLIQDVGVGSTVDMAVKLGLRSYADKGTHNTGVPLADYVKKANLGSFTLGPDAVNALELSNVGATIASGGMWCPPSPIESITDRNGKSISLTEDPCERVIDKGLANNLALAMSKDDAAGGTSANAAGAAGWTLPMSGKTGTTEAHRSSAFLGFTSTMSAAVYAYNDSPTTSELCTSPLRQCGWGNLFGGNEPARTWYGAISPIAKLYGDVVLPPKDPDYARGTARSDLPDVVGMSQSGAVSRLKTAGYKVETQFVSNTGLPYGTVVSLSSGLGLPGSAIVLSVSDGSASPPRADSDDEDADDGTGDGGGGDSQPGDATGTEAEVLEVPGLPPITIAPPR